MCSNESVGQPILSLNAARRSGIAGRTEAFHSWDCQVGLEHIWEISKKQSTTSRGTEKIHIWNDVLMKFSR